MQRGFVQQASSQICSVKLSSLKRNITTATLEWKGKTQQLEKSNKSKEQQKLSQPRSEPATKNYNYLRLKSYKC